MSDTIGRITVPGIVLSTGGSGISGTQVFPLVTQHPFGMSVERSVIVHRFGTLDAKQEQRYYSGIGPRKFQFRRPNLNWSESRALRAFWEDMQGAWKAFTYNVPNPDSTTTATLVTFDQAPLSLEYLRNAVQAGLTFVEVVDPAQAPSYTVASTCVRFPSSALSTALSSEVQQIVPLIHIRVREQAVPDIYLSDRRVTVGSQLYLPRLIGIGEPGSDAIISQDIKGSSDNVRFTFGNADRVMTQLANDTDLKYAEIDLCLFHVNSGILLQLWKGVIQNFVSDGTASFPVTCSDGFFQIMNQYPERVVSRQCWKIFDDGVNCPYAAHGSGGDPASCDYYLESANGCQAHGMAKYFGGQQADPQGVNILDNSTGFAGLGRNKVTATSIISDTVWGLALPEIWCNSGGNPLFAFFAIAMLVAYRDESDYADSLGILGAGPLGGFTASMVVQNADGYRYVVAPMVDGFLWQGLKLDGNLNVSKYQPGYGLRYIPGNDPANPATDSFSLGQGSPQVWQPNIFAAGTAACEIRIQKDSKIQPSTPDQHQMKVPIDFGLWGWTWDKDGNRSAVRGLVNPFWIAVNMVLRAMGLYGDPSTGSNPAGGSGPASADQVAAFVLPSLIAGDGSGAAEIAAAQVPPILGATSGTAYSITAEGQVLNGAQINRNPDGSWTFQYCSDPQNYYDGQQNLVVLPIADAVAAGYAEVDTYAITETQFQFQGVISTQKPFRDWLAEVLNCCLGFYTWEFGKLKLGCRINASAVDAYTQANMLFQSLRLTPIQAAFEKLVLSFADVAYAYQANTAEYCDKSHAAYYGRAQSPLTSQMHSVGCSTLSQALRIAATRVREEIGGINPTEWRSARVATWGTTLLGLGNEVGQVVSITHPDVPGGTGKFRIQRWSLRKDWSVQIEAQTVTDSMYDLDQGPKPADVTPAPLPGLFYPIPLGPAWAPYQVQAASWDALFPNEWTFDSNQTYTILADGSALANLIITGKLPVNQFSPGAGAPGIGSSLRSTTGGSLPANTTLRAALCAIDSDGRPSPPSNIVLICTGQQAGGSFTLDNITWPAVAGLACYVLFVGAEDGQICAQATGNLTPGENNTYTPGSITFGGPLARSTWALPSPYVSKIRVKGKRIAHSGIIGAPVTAVNAPNQIVSSWLIDTEHLTSFNPVGRVLSIIGRPESSAPFLNLTITAYDSATGTLTVSPQAVVTGRQELSVQVDDVFVIRYKADAENSATPTQITDSGCQNVEYPDGMAPGSEVGNVLRVIAGTGRGQLRKITGNTPTQLSWDLPLVLDQTSVWIVEAPAWDYTGDSTTINNADSLRAVTLNIPTDNYIDQALLVAGFTVDVNGNESGDGDVPLREDWVFGAEGAGKVAGFTLPANGVLGIQADAAPAFYLAKDFTAGAVKAYLKSAPLGSALVLSIYIGAGSDPWMTLTIPAGSKSAAATAAQIDGAETIPANTNIRLAITAVGTVYPGADLSVFVYS
jgi:hypothetical protein